MNNKILIVDDDSSSLMLQQTILQRLGFYTQISVNGLDAIKIIKQDIPDVILLDIFMPQMDGFETLSVLQKNHSNIPIIIVTAGGAKTIKKLKEMNVKFYIQKPITPTKLQSVLSKCLNIIN